MGVGRREMGVGRREMGERGQEGDVSVLNGCFVCPGIRSRLQRIAQEVAARRIGYNKRKPPPVRKICSGSGVRSNRVCEFLWVLYSILCGGAVSP